MNNFDFETIEYAINQVDYEQSQAVNGLTFTVVGSSNERMLRLKFH